MLQLLAVLAGLIGNAAAGLAGRLTRSLALAATAVLSAVAQITGLNGNDMLHVMYLPKFNRIDFIIFKSISQLLSGEKVRLRMDMYTKYTVCFVTIC